MAIEILPPGMAAALTAQAAQNQAEIDRRNRDTVDGPPTPIEPAPSRPPVPLDGPPIVVPDEPAPEPSPAPTGNTAQGPTPITLPAVAVTARRIARTITQPDGTPVERVSEVPVTTPNEALQKAAPINSPLRSSYDFVAEVLVNGKSVGAPFTFEVSKNNNYQADRYYVMLLISGLPKEYDKAFWSSGDQKQIEIRCGYADGKTISLITGLIDDSETAWRTNELTLRGRDLTSLLIDNKTAEKFANKTSSQIVEAFAKRRGLSAVVTQTTTLVGQYFQREHAQLNADQSEHDLIKELAEFEGFDYWLDGTTLHFEPPKPENDKPFVVRYIPPTNDSIANGTFIELKTKRSETLAKDIVVTVTSFEPKKGKAVTATARRSRVKTTGSKVASHTTSPHGVITPYNYRIPGLDKPTAQAYANKLAEQISKYERVITVAVPFDPVIDVRTRVSLRGTGTDFDQAYFIDSIEYSASFEQGARMEITARNSSPQTSAMT